MKITTERLELIASTLELAHAEIEDRDRFAQLLDARVPIDWPPPLNDTDSMKWFLGYLKEHPDGSGWTNWYFVLRRDEAVERRVIGNGGFKGKPTADGMVEVGYSIMEDHQRQGFAPEAVAALIGWAFSHPEVTRVAAETFPELRASIRVMEKNALIYCGPGLEEGTIRYERTRS